MSDLELFVPRGKLSLSPEQSEQIAEAFGEEISVLPIFQVQSDKGGDIVLPVQGIPDLQGVILHRDAEKSEKGEPSLIASVLSEMRDSPEAVFAAHTKLVAPRPANEARKKK